MGGLGMGELVLIFLVVLLVFGAKRIPEIARGIGQGIKEFKNATNDITREITQEDQPRQFNRSRRSPQGAPTPRGSTAAEPPAEEPVPQEPVRADNPGDPEEEQRAS